MFKINIIIGVLLALLVTTACSSAAAETSSSTHSISKPEVVLKASGSATTTAILARIAPAFEADRPGYRIKTLTGTGTGGGVEGMMSGALDVAAMGRAPTDKEAPQVEFVSLGLGGEIPIAHADIPIRELTTEQLTAVFSGEISNWSELGGPDLPIIVYVRGDSTAHTKALRQAVFGDTPFVETGQVMGGLGDMLTAVEGTPGSVGYANWPAVVSKGAKVQAIAVDGVGPDDPTYTAALQLGIGYLPERQAEVQPLVDWLQSERGQAMLAESGVIITQ